MKKFINAALAALLVLPIAACGGGAQTSSQTATTAAKTATAAPAAKTATTAAAKTATTAAAKTATTAAAKTATTAAKTGGGFKVGVSMPTKSLQRWNQDGDNMKTQFEAQGYTVDLQYGGDNDVQTQISQIQNMISGGCQALVIAAIDGSSLTEVLKDAKAKNIPVIAYDRLIMNSDAVTYYATFDNFKVGVLQGNYIRDALKLDTAAGPFNIELFTGSPDDNNIHFFFGGAMSVLQPYIDSGKLVVKSGQTKEADCATPSWSTEKAQARMENLISQYNYSPSGTKLDAVYSSNDSVGQGISNALKNAGYNAKNFPIVTGQDCDKASVINMRNGLQAMSVFKDTRTLAAAVVKMVQEIQSGAKVDVNDTKTYNNGTGIIPSFLCDPVSYTIADINKLVDSGYYKWDDIGGAQGTLPLDSQIGGAPATAAVQNTDASFKVGVSMPTKSLQRWNQDGDNMKTQFEALGYTVDLQYGGDNDVQTQISQIENMITGGCKVLIIAAIDGNSLTEVLKNAKSSNIPVIAYDRLIMNTDAVSYYATFDNFKVGVLQGNYIRDALKLDTAAGPFNAELFTGSPDDNNIHFFFGGAMSVLQPYIDSGKLVVKSGQTKEADCATPSWSTEKAQARMENLISQYSYSPSGTKLDAVYSSNDSVGQGISNALKNAGYDAKNFPIVTGQDCDKASVINMRNGLQAMSVFKDTRTLAAAVVKMVQEVQSGSTVDVNDTKTYNNGTGVIPSFLCDPVSYTIADIGKLVDSGYYKWDDIGGAKGTLPLDSQIK